MHISKKKHCRLIIFLSISMLFLFTNSVLADTGIWSALGGGMNNMVNALAVNGNNLYAGGYFKSADGVIVNKIAEWDGSSWSPLTQPGTGDVGVDADGHISALVMDSDDLYVGGQFRWAGGVQEANNIAKWDGSWSALGDGVNSNVNALAVYGNNLYVGGYFTAAGGVAANRIAKWDGTSWEALGEGMNDIITALAVDSNGILYAGGNFTTAGGVHANRIAKWNGTSWSALGTGMNNDVSALVVDGSDLYVGGFFTTAGGVDANRIAKWNINTSNWSALGDGMGAGVQALSVDANGNLYAGGGFLFSGSDIVNNIVRWDTITSTWAPLNNGVNNQVLALATSNVLYAGGTFTKASGVTVNKIAEWADTAPFVTESNPEDNSTAKPRDNVQVKFNEDVLHDGSANAANNIGNYLLVEADGDGFQTTSCSAGADVDDSEIIPLSAFYSNNAGAGPFHTSIGLPTLSVGSYQMFVCGTETIYDLVGNKLNGGSDTIIRFTIETTPPTISTTVPANGATIESINSILVNFSEDVMQGGNEDAADNIHNYLLVEANGNGFETTSCGAGRAGNDIEKTILSAVYSNNNGNGPFRATLSVPTLENGDYRLFICGTATILDLAGNVLNGGADSIVNFTVAGQAEVNELPKTGFTPGVITQLRKQEPLSIYQQFDSISLEIPSLGVETPIVGVPISKDGWDLTWLADKAGWLHGTAFPSWAGNSAITAHVVDANGQPGLFSDLNALKWGDKIVVHAYGQAYVYEIRSVEKYVRPDDTSSVFKHEEYPWLTLITCRGYDEVDNEYNWRVVVRAVQVDVQ